MCEVRNWTKKKGSRTWHVRNGYQVANYKTLKTNKGAIWQSDCDNLLIKKNETGETNKQKTVLRKQIEITKQ